MNNQLLKKVFRSWYHPLSPIFRDSYFTKLLNEINNEYKIHKQIYPKKNDIFKPFKLTNYNDVRIVVIGDRPYLSGKANGLAFGNNADSLVISPTLEKIHKLIEDELFDGLYLDFDVTLESYAKKGVMLLNDSLTINKSKPGDHYKYWYKFNQKLIEILNENKTGIIYCLIGCDTDKYEKIINKKFNYILYDIESIPEIIKLLKENNG